MSASFEFEEVDRFVTGAVGRPGSRVFFLEVVTAAGSVWFKIEKQQVAALAEHLRRMMADLPQPVVTLGSGARFSAPGSLEDAAFVVGTMSAGYEPDRDRVVMLVEEFVALDENGDPEPEAAATQGRARLSLRREQVVGFVAEAEIVVAGGRPLCRWCGLPIDPDGHNCPRSN